MDTPQNSTIKSRVEGDKNEHCENVKYAVGGSSLVHGVQILLSYLYCLSVVDEGL